MAERPVKDQNGEERSVPEIWRPTLCEIVRALAAKDYELSRGIPSVVLQASDTPRHNRESIGDFGQTLTELPDDAWKTAVAMWTGTHWEVLVDLWTIESGCSDLVLHLHVFEVDAGFRFEVYMAYVP